MDDDVLKKKFSRYALRLASISQSPYCWCCKTAWNACYYRKQFIENCFICKNEFVKWNKSDYSINRNIQWSLEFQKHYFHRKSMGQVSVKENIKIYYWFSIQRWSSIIKWADILIIALLSVCPSVRPFKCPLFIFEPLMRFTNNSAQMSSMTSWCAVRMFGQGQGYRSRLTLYDCIMFPRYIFLTPAQMSSMMSWCAVRMFD